MKTIHIRDRFNSSKIWIIKRSKCGHYYVNQIIMTSPSIGFALAVNYCKPFYKTFTRTTAKSIQTVLNIESIAARFGG